MKHYLIAFSAHTGYVVKTGAIWMHQPDYPSEKDAIAEIKTTDRLYQIAITGITVMDEKQYKLFIL